MDSARSELIELVEEGTIDKDHLILDFVNFLTNEEVIQFCELNDISIPSVE